MSDTLSRIIAATDADPTMRALRAAEDAVSLAVMARQLEIAAEVRGVARAPERAVDVARHVAKARELLDGMGVSPDVAALASFVALRDRVFAAIRRVNARSIYGKSYEGAWEIHTPPICSDGVRIMLHCYLIGPSRHYDWSAPTLAEAVAKAATDVDAWIAESDAQIAEDFAEIGGAP